MNPGHSKHCAAANGSRESARSSPAIDWPTSDSFIGCCQAALPRNPTPERGILLLGETTRSCVGGGRLESCHSPVKISHGPIYGHIFLVNSYTYGRMRRATEVQNPQFSQKMPTPRSCAPAMHSFRTGYSAFFLRPLP